MTSWNGSCKRIFVEDEQGTLWLIKAWHTDQAPYLEVTVDYEYPGGDLAIIAEVRVRMIGPLEIVKASV